MGDLYVHVRMKECCRTTLKDLDKRKKKAKFKGGVLGVKSLAEALGEKTIDEAKAAIPGGGEAGGQLEALTRAACEKVCERHAGVHEGKGETEEGAFWRDLAAAITGKPAPKRVAKVGALAGAGAGGAGKERDGQTVAELFFLGEDGVFIRPPGVSPEMAPEPIAPDPVAPEPATPPDGVKPIEKTTPGEPGKGSEQNPKSPWEQWKKLQDLQKGKKTPQGGGPGMIA